MGWRDLDLDGLLRGLQKRLVRFGQVGDAERRVVLAIALLAPAVTAALRGFGMARARWLAARLAERAPLAPREVPAQRVGVLVDSIGDAIDSVSALKVTCLARSLVLCALLERRGERPVLMLGVRPRATALDAHAWVELDGAALLSPAPDGQDAYTPLTQIRKS